MKFLKNQNPLYFLIPGILTLLAVSYISAEAAEKKPAKKADKVAEDTNTGEVPLGDSPASSEKTGAAKADAKPGEEVDISDVQNQYWKSHDKQFEVIQNKLYTKAGRFEITPMFGIYQRVDFQDTKTLGGTVAYHFSEIIGAEIMAHKMYNSDSSVVTRFKETRGATVAFNEEKYFMGATMLFTPIYGKFSLFGKKISHFDLYLSPGLGVTKTNDLRFTTCLGVGQKFWVSPHFNVRIEYRWNRYNDKIYTSEGATAVRNGGPGYFEQITNDQNLMFGISYLF